MTVLDDLLEGFDPAERRDFHGRWVHTVGAVKKLLAGFDIQHVSETPRGDIHVSFRQARDARDARPKLAKAGARVANLSPFDIQIQKPRAAAKARATPDMHHAIANLARGHFLTAAEAPLDALLEAFNPDEPRGWHGRWSAIGHALGQALKATTMDSAAHTSMRRAVELHGNDRTLHPATLRSIRGHLGRTMGHLQEPHDRSDRSGGASHARMQVHVAQRAVDEALRRGYEPSASHVVARLIRGSTIYAQ